MLDTILLGLACMSAPLFAKYAGYEIKKKPFDMVGISGLFFILAASFTVGPARVVAFHQFSDTGTLVSYLIGWGLLVIGALQGMLDVLLEHNHRTLLKTH